MKIYLGSDHAGFELKNKMIPFLGTLGHEVIDLGAHKLDAEDDYPDFISLVAKEVSKDSEDKELSADLSRGIIFGGSGQGEAIVANRFPYVRAVVYYGGNEEIIKLSREHNDANILSLGARFLKEEEALEAIKMWLDTPFSEEERHIRRIIKIDENK